MTQVISWKQISRTTPRAGDIGEPLRHIELEPLTAPATAPAEPAIAPAPAVEPEPVPA